MEDYTTYKLSYWPTEAKKVNIQIYKYYLQIYLQIGKYIIYLQVFNVF